MITKRSRVLSAPVEDVWAVLADPWAMPRWWPHTQRMEGVNKDGWTTVLENERTGRAVRADWRLDTSKKPSLRRWSQELAGSPFERLFALNVVEARLEPVDGATTVTLSFEQRVRGWARLAPFVIRRAMRRQLDDALGGLAAAVER